MGLFQFIFRGRDKDAALPIGEAAVLKRLPFETVVVAGKDAFESCLDLRDRAEGLFTPVILGNVGDANDLGILLEGMELNESTPDEILEAANAIEVESFIAQRLEMEDDEFGGVEEGEWPQEANPSSEITGPLDLVTGKPHRSVGICKVPTADSWEVPAYLAFGGWNECPAPEEHVAMLRYWHEKYGAELITLTNDVLECTVSRPPVDAAEAMLLAKEQFVYCPDVVYQGTQTLAALAASLLHGKTWFFWWD